MTFGTILFSFFDIFLFLQYNLDILNIFATESGQKRDPYSILTTILKAWLLAINITGSSNIGVAF